MPKPTFHFTLDTDAARARLTALLEAAETGTGHDEDFEIDSQWSARGDDAMTVCSMLVSAAQSWGVLTCTTPDCDVALDYERTEDGGYMTWYVNLSLPNTEPAQPAHRISVLAGGVDPWKIGDPDTTGVESALSVLNDTVIFANTGVQEIEAFIAAYTR